MVGKRRKKKMLGDHFVPVLQAGSNENKFFFINRRRGIGSRKRLGERRCGRGAKPRHSKIEEVGEKKKTCPKNAGHSP